MTAPVLSSANRAQLRYIPEASYGVTPVTGNGKKLRMTGESLDYALTKTGDKEIRDDRQEVSCTTTSAALTGGIKTHMQYAEYDTLLAAALQTTIAPYGTNGVGTTFTAAITATTITAGSAPTGANAFTTLQKGQWFKLNAPSDANDGLILRVSTITAPTSTVITLDVSTVAVVSASVANSSIATTRMTNGVTQPSFTIERGLADVTQFFTYRGMTVSKWATSFASGALTEPTIDFMGKDMIRATSTQMPGTVTSSFTYNIQNAVTGVGNLWEAGVPLASTFIKKLDISIDNTLRAQDAIGVLGSAGIGSGACKVSGAMDLYLADGSLMDKYLADTYTSLTVSTKDSAGNGYVITLPKVMITKVTLAAGSRDTDVMLAITWEAKADITNAVTALQQTIFIDRFGAAVAITF